MNTSLNQPAQQGDIVAYYQARGLRRIGVVQELRDGKVLVQLVAGETVLVDDIELYLIEESRK